MLTVHLRVSDSATRMPTPVRIRLVDAEGVYRVPFGRLDSFATTPGTDVGGQLAVDADKFAYIDGMCEVRLPAGPLQVEVSKGPEYLPLRREVTLGPGQISLRLEVQRWIDLRQQGWYSGDTRALALSPHVARLEGSAEDLAVVNLLARDVPACENGERFLSNILAFSGTKPTLDSPECQVVVNTLNEHPVLGTFALLNSHRAVYPLRFGQPDGNDDWSLTDWAEQCHRKRGLVVWPDLPRASEEHLQGEALAVCLTGQVDAFEVCSFDDLEPENLGLWYQLLDCGLRLPIVGGSGKASNAVPLGNVRTYAHLGEGEPFSYSAWINAVRTGRTFVTNDPLLFFTANGQLPGGVLEASPDGTHIALQVEARGRLPFDQIEVLQNSSVVATRPTSGNRESALLDAGVTVTESCWLAARCWSEERLRGTGQYVYAQTSPIYVHVPGRPMKAPAATVASLNAVLQQTKQWVRDRADCPTEKQREQLLAHLQTAVEVL